MTAHPPTAALEAARRTEGEAAVAYEEALDSRGAIDNDDPKARDAWFTLVAEKSSAWVYARLRRMRLELSTFEQLLTNSALQFDGDSAVMRSIADYQNATKGTMDVPLTNASTAAWQAGYLRGWRDYPTAMWRGFYPPTEEEMNDEDDPA